jgi:uncharacterized membrane protein YdjX (TVP38/TMEM64 family)
MSALRTWWKPAAAVLAIVALAAAWRFTPLHDYLTGERLRDWARFVRETPWAWLALVLAYTPAAFLMFPRPVLTLIAVIAFGRWLGFVYAMTGILLSAFAAFYAGRLMRPQTLRRYAGRYYEPASRELRRHGLAAVFIMRVLPTAPHAVASALAGALRVKAWHFGVGTFLGMLPGVLAATVFGGEIASALDEPSAVSYWLAGGALVLIGLSLWWLRRWAKRHGG